MRTHDAARLVNVVYSPIRTPRAIAGAKLVLDLDADQYEAAAGAWVDRSSYGNTVAQPDASKRPTQVLNALDGHSAVKGNGVDQSLYRYLSLTGLVIGDFANVYLVRRNVSGAASVTGMVAELSVGGNYGSGVWIQRFNTDLGIKVNNSSPGIGYTDVPVLTELLTARVNTCMALDVNGVRTQGASLVPPTGIATAIDSLFLFRTANNNYFSVDEIYRLIIVKNPTYAEHVEITQYLRRTYPSLGIAAPASAEPPESILGALYHSDIDVADPQTSISIGKVVSVPNRGLYGGTLTQAVSANRLAYNATGLDGLGPSMDSNGVARAAYQAYSPNLALTQMWIVAKWISGDLQAGLDTIFALYRDDYYQAGVGSPGAGAHDTSRWHVTRCGDLSTTASTFVVDETMTRGLTYGALSHAITGLTLGGWVASGGGAVQSPGAYRIRRVIVANGVPSPAQITAMKDYFKSLPYGLTLP